MKRKLQRWLAIVFACVAAGALTRYHTVSAGLFLDPPAPSVSVFVPAWGFPLPAIARTTLPEFGGPRTIVFWRALFANAVCAVAAGTLGWALLLAAATVRTRILRK